MAAATTDSTASTTTGARRSRASTAKRSRSRGAPPAAAGASATWDTLAVRDAFAYRRPPGAAVVAAGQMVLEEDVEHDEQVAAAHLLQPQLGLAVGPVRPGDRDDRVGVPAHDRLER